MEQHESSKTTAERLRARYLLAHLQNRIAAAFDIQPADREAVVRTMLDKSGRAPAGYWLQLLLAMGIASLGLVLGSTAVVIGAMLISPLMSPIVELGMGLAIGSPFLFLRSTARVIASIIGVVICSALLTLALPFSEVTSEIATRTTPTALDLLIATFCALAAAYTSVRPGSDTTSTAAGTAIGIALVPPPLRRRLWHRHRLPDHRERGRAPVHREPVRDHPVRGPLLPRLRLQHGERRDARAR